MNLLTGSAVGALLVLAACSTAPTKPPTAGGPAPVLERSAPANRRMPAEWEPQAAIWLQWPRPYEGPGVEAAFVRIVDVLARYESVHLLAHDARTEENGRAALARLSADRVSSIRWHRIPNDSSWMRDNGPRYVEIDGEVVLQDWGFDAWGGGFGRVPYACDDVVPRYVAGLLDIGVEEIAIVHERGDLEVNGTDTVIVNWSVIGHRNPDMTRDEIRAGLENALGVTSVIFLEGYDEADGTRGHVDGAARFVSENTVVVPRYGDLSDAFADQISAQRPDLIVERPDGNFDVNWLVGDGFVLTGSSGDPLEDEAARELIQHYYPERDVHFVDAGAIYAGGGGIHCVTNDQPEAPRPAGR